MGSFYLVQMRKTYALRQPFTRCRTIFGTVENSCVYVFLSHGTTLTVRRRSRSKCRERTENIERSRMKEVSGQIFNRSKIRPVPCGYYARSKCMHSVPNARKHSHSIPNARKYMYRLPNAGKYMLCLPSARKYIHREPNAGKCVHRLQRTGKSMQCLPSVSPSVKRSKAYAFNIKREKIYAQSAERGKICALPAEHGKLYELSA